jgi:hypothetical protein
MSVNEKAMAVQLALGEISNAEKKRMIREVKASMGPILVDFSEEISSQNFALLTIQDVFCHHAHKAQTYVDSVKAKDRAYKQSLVDLGLSVIKLGLSSVHLADMVDIAQSLQDIISNSLVRIEERLSNIVTDIEDSVDQAHDQVFRNVENRLEKQLLAHTGPEDLKMYWIQYRAAVNAQSYDAIKDILDKTLKTDDFIWCTILAAIEANPSGNPLDWTNTAAEKFDIYVKRVFDSLSERVSLIKLISKNILQKDVSDEIVSYFKKIGLADYVLAQDGKRGLEGWLTNKVGRELSKQFPGIFQSKIRPIWLGRKPRSISARRTLKSEAEIVLRSGPNTEIKKQQLFDILRIKKCDSYTGLVEKLHRSLEVCAQRETDADTRFSTQKAIGGGIQLLSHRKIGEFDIDGENYYPEPDVQEELGQFIETSSFHPHELEVTTPPNKRKSSYRSHSFSDSRLPSMFKRSDSVDIQPALGSHDVKKSRKLRRNTDSGNLKRQDSQGSVFFSKPRGSVYLPHGEPSEPVIEHREDEDEASFMFNENGGPRDHNA